MCNKIIEGICNVLKQDVALVKSGSRTNEVTMCRIIISYHLRNYGLTFTEMGSYLNRTHGSLCRNLDKYENNYKYNKFFREKAEKCNKVVEELLKCS